MDRYRQEVLDALDRARLRLAYLNTVADARLPIGDGARGLECGKAGAFLAEVAEGVNQLMFDLVDTIDEHVKPFSLGERALAATAIEQAVTPLIEALRMVARSYGLDSHETLRKRYRKQP